MIKSQWFIPGGPVISVILIQYFTDGAKQDEVDNQISEPFFQKGMLTVSSPE